MEKQESATHLLVKNQRQLELMDKEEDSTEISSNTQISPQTTRKWKIIFTCCGILIFVAAILVFVFGIFNYSPPVIPPPPPEKWNQIQLPSYIRPQSYSLRIETDFSNFTFSISETVNISVFQPTDTIVMHSSGLSIDVNSVFLQNSLGEIAPLTSIDFNSTLEFVYFQFSQLSQWTSMDQQSFILSFNFSGILSTRMSGYYRSSYIENGTTQWLAATDFEPTNARKAFVCFDEPAMKAQFTYTMIVPSEYTALTNMPELSTTILPSGQKQVNFQTSVKMSTYLVCFIACKFLNIQSGTSPVNVRVWATPSTIQQTNYALYIARNVLTFYEGYFAIPFPLPKLDLIALPDFSAGAMENWGLITFRSTALLYDPNQSSLADKKRVAVVIAHEISHQWFGNLVTMQWWNDLWLNEGFATFMEYIGVNYVEPQWDIWNDFLIADRGVALELDSLSTTHPLSVDLVNPQEILQQFDAISYSKGGSIIRMLQGYLNSQNPSFFTGGLRNYLSTFSYSNAKTSDLWNSFSQVSGIPNLPSFMDTWTLQKGFPYLTVNSSYYAISVSQSRFLLTKDQRAANNQLWWIPLSMKTATGTTMESTLDIEPIKYFSNMNFGYLIINYDGTGYYRTNYDDLTWAFIIYDLKLNYLQFENVTRAILLDDIFALASADITSPSNALDLASYLKNEVAYLPWVMGLSGLNSFAKHLDLQSFYGNYQNFVLSLINDTYFRLGWTSVQNESYTDLLLRFQILNAACSYGHFDCVSKAQKLFSNFMLDPIQYDIPTDLRNVVYYTAVERGGETEYNWLLKRYQINNVAAEKIRCLNALTKTRIPYLIQRTLELSLDTNVVRPQDTAGLINQLSSNVYARDLTWDFFRENYNIFETRYSSNAFTLPSIINGVTRYLSTNSNLQELQDFSNSHSLDAGSRAIQNALETVAFNVQWLNLHQQIIKNWLIQWSGQ